MRPDPCRTVLSGKRQVLLAIMEIRLGQHLAARIEPLDTAHAVARLAVGLPAGRKGPPESVQRVLDPIQGQVVRVGLDHQDDDIHVVEKIEIDMLDRKIDLLPIVVAQPRALHVGSAKHPDRGVSDAILVQPDATLAVQEALHVRQEGHEFAVVALLELAGIGREFVLDLAPGIRAAALRQVLPVALHLLALTHRHQLQGPHQDLPEVAHDRHAGLGHGLFRVARGIDGARIMGENAEVRAGGPARSPPTSKRHHPFGRIASDTVRPA